MRLRSLEWGDGLWVGSTGLFSREALLEESEWKAGYERPRQHQSIVSALPGSLTVSPDNQDGPAWEPRHLLARVGMDDILSAWIAFAEKACGRAVLNRGIDRPWHI